MGFKVENWDRILMLYMVLFLILHPQPGVVCVRWNRWVAGPPGAVALGHAVEYKFVPCPRPVNWQRSRKACQAEGGDLLHSPSRELLQEYLMDELLGAPPGDHWRVWAYSRHTNGKVNGRSCRALEIWPRWGVTSSSCGSRRDDVMGYICVRPADGTTAEVLMRDYSTVAASQNETVFSMASVEIEAVGLWCCLQCEISC